MPIKSLKDNSVFGPFYKSNSTVRIQSVLFNNSIESLYRSLTSVRRMVEMSLKEKICSQLVVAWGDCSPQPIMTESLISEFRGKFSDYFHIEYSYFNANLGSAGGHNVLNESNKSDFLLIQNPDVVVSARTLEYLLKPFSIPNVGMVEAKQLPIEHPKDYHPVTGETSWASTASAIIPSILFNYVGGFDADTFFLYCDDVDLSWMVRETGLRIIYQPSALVFHDKRLSSEAGWIASDAERYYSAEATLLMYHKWSREDLRIKTQKYFNESGDDFQKKASAAFDKRLRDGRLPPKHDLSHEVAFFEGGFFANHRFPL